VFTDVKPGGRERCGSPKEEIFGPVTSVIPVSTLDEALDIVNGRAYGLSSAIYTQDQAVNQAFIAMKELIPGSGYGKFSNDRSRGRCICRLAEQKEPERFTLRLGTQVARLYQRWKIRSIID